MKYSTIRDAARAWVHTFNAIPQSVVEKLMEVSDSTDIQEVTPFPEDEFPEGCDTLPMWGTMWAFGDNIDNDWIRGEFGQDGLQLMADCGFRIYESEDWDYIFGIDGCGYDFYEEHWIPLYKARGLHWHEED